MNIIVAIQPSGAKGFPVASYPGSRWAGKERAWYPLFAHVLNFQESLGNWKLLCYIRITVTTECILTATSSAHFLSNDGGVSIARSPGLFSSLQRLGTCCMSLKKVQVVPTSDFCWLLPGKSVWYHWECCTVDLSELVTRSKWQLCTQVIP